MNKERRGISPSIILVFILLAVTVWMSFWNNADTDYSKSELVADLQFENVTAVKIQPNKETPTGVLSVQLKDGDVKTLYVTDVTEYEVLLIEAGV